MSNTEYINIQGARVHNLKNISVQLPHNKLIVITGLSGSGKSTLAFDTIFAEGQRRYVESLSSYARQFLGKIQKPDVDLITGISPAIAVEQKVNTRNPRSTVGTSTEIYEYLRLLFGRIGKTISPVSGKEVHANTTEEIVEFILSQKEGARLLITAPIVVAETETVIEKLTLLMQDGFRRVVSEGDIYDIEDFIRIENIKSWGVLIDRVQVTNSSDNELRIRLQDSVERSLSLSKGDCHIYIHNNKEPYFFSTRFELDGLSFERPSDYLFSFNNPIGACSRCEGYGKVVGIDEDLVVPDKSKSIYDNAIACWRGETMQEWKNQLIKATKNSGIPIHKPFHELTREQKLLVWSGNKYFDGLNSFFKMLENGRYKIQYRVMLSRYTGKSICPDCSGGRLRKEAGYVFVDGKSITELVFMSINELHNFFTNLSLDDRDRQIGSRIITEIINRVGYLQDVGLGYLSLDRQSSTLSGGESQRINLSTSLGSSLVGSLYILDEPSIGLHPRDTARLINVLRQLRDLGNTVIVVEHDIEIMLSADIIIDMGPYAGRLGGEVVYNGTIDNLSSVLDKSLTAQYLLGKDSIAIPKKERVWKDYIEIQGARQNNLKNLNIKIPLGILVCVTGVSGSGKSSLISDILYPALRREILDLGSTLGDFDRLDGSLKKIKSVELVDQNPIGKSLRSNPVTYIKAYDEIRKLFAELPRSKAMGFNPSSFSFNMVGGRCEHCKGEGKIRIEMQFMADVELICEHCNGKRFKDNLLEVKYNNKNIHDILEMDIDGAVLFFDTFAQQGNRICHKIVEKLSVLQSVGLGYVKLGQSSSTLSGGESQRVKLAYFLQKEHSTKHTLFIFDEPTTGLHFHDIKKLLRSINSLIDKGHSVVIVEHNMDVVKSCDWVIDLGAEGGSLGGSLVFEGTPKALAYSGLGYTSEYLKPLYEGV